VLGTTERGRSYVLTDPNARFSVPRHKRRGAWLADRCEVAWDGAVEVILSGGSATATSVTRGSVDVLWRVRVLLNVAVDERAVDYQRSA